MLSSNFLAQGKRFNFLAQIFFWHLALSAVNLVFIYPHKNLLHLW
jgi:hypothetical protein